MILNSRQLYIKIFSLIAMILFSLNIYPAKGQKNNYEQLVYYGDDFVDRILNSERYVSNSNFQFHGEISNVLIIENSRDSIKYFFNEEKNNYKLINYNYGDSHKILVQEYYYKSRFNTVSILKEIYEINNSDTLYHTKSKLNQKSKEIILYKYRDNKTIEIDSILYQNNFEPIERKIYDFRGKRIIGIEKTGFYNKKLFKKYRNSNSFEISSFRKYDDHQNRQYLINKITLEEYEKIDFNYVGDPAKRSQIFQWNEKNFTYQEDHSSKKKYSFNYHEKSLNSINHSFKSIIYFNDFFMPSIIVKTNEKLGIDSKTTFLYNANMDLVKRSYSNHNSTPSEYFFKYEYDSKGNWYLKMEYENNQLISTIKRVIEYE